jgi:Cucumopine synthase C-terminal helical bundle domain
MRQIEIEWLPIGRKVTADLYEEQNGALAHLLWDNLPYNSVQSHALVSGDHLYHVAPIAELVWTQATQREDRTKSPYGSVFLSHLQHMAVKYGELTEYLSAAKVGQVIEADIPLLRQAGQEIWNAVYRTKQVIEVRVTRKGEPTDRFVLPQPLRAQARNVDQLVQEIHDETQRIWITPPQELVDIHAGRIKSRAGSRDQFFTTMLFVNGEQRPFGYGALGGLVKSCVKSDISLEALKQITPNFIKTPAEFLGYCGLDTQWDFTQRTIALLDEIQSKEDYLALMAAMSTYANCLNGWNLHYFPWKHGEEYRYDAALAAEFGRVDSKKSRGTLQSV